jgi:Mycobacterium membrane protein
MHAPSLHGLLRRFWVVIVIVVALVVAGFVVGRLRTYFGSDLPGSAMRGDADAIVAFNPKRVTYEVVGPATATGAVSYLDANGQSHQDRFDALPWSVTITTTDPGIFANVVAQGDSRTLGCRIVVNGKVTAHQQAQGRDAQAFCLDKAA